MGSPVDQVIADTNAAPPPPDSAGDPVLDAVYANGAASTNLGPTPGAQIQGSPLSSPSTPTPGDPGSNRVAGSASYRGMTDAGIKRAGDLFGRAEAAGDREEQPYQQEIQRERDDLDRDVNTGREGIREQAVQDHEHFLKLQEFENKKAEIDQHAADAQRAANLEGQAVRDHYVHTLETQLAGVAQLAKTTGNPIGDLTRTQALGLAGAKFVQGMLAVQGINIDVGSQIDHWVDTSIKEHQMLIDNARGAANDTIHLYDIARQNSQDDYEARQRYRAMVIEGLQSQVEGESARWQSGLATSRAQQMISKLELEKDAVKRDLGARAASTHVQFQQMKINEAHAQGQLAVASMQASASLANAKAKQAAAEAKARQGVSYYADPTTGKVIARITKGTTGDVSRTKLAVDAIKAYKQMSPMMADYVQQVREAQEQGWTGARVSELTDPKFRRLQELRTNIALVNTKATNGTRSSDQEFERQLDLVPTNKAWQEGNNDAIVNDLLKHTRQEFASTMDAVSDKTQNDDGSFGLTKAERGYTMPDDAANADPALKAETEAFDAPNRGSATREERLYADAVTRKESPQTKADPFDPTYQKTDPHTTTRMSKAWVDAEGGGYSKFQKEQPGWAVAMDVMAQEVAHGKLDNWGPQHDDIATRLESIAGGQGRAKNIPGDRRAYAKALVERLEKDPKDLLSDLSERIDSANKPGTLTTGEYNTVTGDAGDAAEAGIKRTQDYWKSKPKKEERAAPVPSAAPPQAPEPDWQTSPDDAGVGDEGE
jgi:hypothetical protein